MPHFAVHVLGSRARNPKLFIPNSNAVVPAYGAVSWMDVCTAQRSFCHMDIAAAGSPSQWEIGQQNQSVQLSKHYWAQLVFWSNMDHFFKEFNSIVIIPVGLKPASTVIVSHTAMSRCLI